jgi:hypothetical protein
MASCNQRWHHTGRNNVDIHRHSVHPYGRNIQTLNNTNRSGSTCYYSRDRNDYLFRKVINNIAIKMYLPRNIIPILGNPIDALTKTKEKTRKLFWAINRQVIALPLNGSQRPYFGLQRVRQCSPVSPQYSAVEQHKLLGHLGFSWFALPHLWHSALHNELKILKLI